MLLPKKDARIGSDGVEEALQLASASDGPKAFGGFRVFQLQGASEGVGFRIISGLAGRMSRACISCAGSSPVFRKQLQQQVIRMVEALGRYGGFWFQAWT